MFKNLYLTSSVIKIIPLHFLKKKLASMFWYRWTKVFGSMLTFLCRVLLSLPLVWANTDIYHWQRLRTCKPFRSDVYLFIKWLFTYEKLAKYLCTRDENLSVKLHKLDSTVCRRRMSPAAHRSTHVEHGSFCFCLYPSFTVYPSLLSIINRR